jgi:hypothetical protein
MRIVRKELTYVFAVPTLAIVLTACSIAPSAPSPARDTSAASTLAAAGVGQPTASANADDAGTPPNPVLGVPFGGTSAAGNEITGLMDVRGFVIDSGILKAIAILNGTITTPEGTTKTVKNITVLIPVDVGGLVHARPQGTAPTELATICNILTLVLGPLELGLTVHLNQVVLVINAVSAPGNLLGNLLCAITNLLNGIDLGNLGTALLTTLTTLLNQLLAAL